MFKSHEISRGTKKQIQGKYFDTSQKKDIQNELIQLKNFDLTLIHNGNDFTI